MRLASMLAVIACALSACDAEEPRSTADIQDAVQSHLSGQTDLRIDQMRVHVDRIRYEGDSALAEVTIAASDDPDAEMKMVYFLERGASGWRVVPPDSVTGSQDPSVTSPGSIPGLPPGHPPTTQPGAVLPPGHPPTTQPPAELPPGHPPVGSGSSL